ncbi:MAG: nickel-dependent hydrogenase large subunit, partial [Methylobacter sp.]|nr:nickel-dependent hydrogenase large subunit [Methylobacter sp.]
KQHLFRCGEAFKLDSRIDISVLPVRQQIDELEALIDATIFNGRLADFQALTSEVQLFDWLWQNDAIPSGLLTYLYSQDWVAAGQSTVACLPDLDADALNRQLQQEDLTAFCQAPHWQGRCFEATLLNRQLSQPLIAEFHRRYANGLIVRILGRLQEVACIPSLLKQLLAGIKDATALPVHNAVSDGTGLAQVQAARGLLIHRVELRQGRVYDYRIIAPTEWNFHPEGVVVQGLKQLKAGGQYDLQRQAELFINAVDPCVQYVLNLMDSRNEIKSHV